MLLAAAATAMSHRWVVAKMQRAAMLAQSKSPIVVSGTPFSKPLMEAPMETLAAANRCSRRTLEGINSVRLLKHGLLKGRKLGNSKSISNQRVRGCKIK